jgi:hypothetical protein
MANNIGDRQDACLTLNEQRPRAQAVLAMPKRSETKVENGLQPQRAEGPKDNSPASEVKRASPWVNESIKFKALKGRQKFFNSETKGRANWL